MNLTSKYQNLFNTDTGREVLRDLAATSGFFGGGFNENPTVHAFNEGKRDLFLHIVSMITADGKTQEQTVNDLLEYNIFGETK